MYERRNQHELSPTRHTTYPCLAVRTQRTRSPAHRLVVGGPDSARYTGARLRGMGADPVPARGNVGGLGSIPAREYGAPPGDSAVGGTASGMDGSARRRADGTGMSAALPFPAVRTYSDGPLSERILAALADYPRLTLVHLAYLVEAEVEQVRDAVGSAHAERGRNTGLLAAGQVRIETLGTAKGQVTYVALGRH